jgi:hypothetical protein
VTPAARNRDRRNRAGFLAVRKIAAKAWYLAAMLALTLVLIAVFAAPFAGVAGIPVNSRFRRIISRFGRKNSRLRGYGNWPVSL